MHSDARLPNDLPGCDALAEALERLGRVGGFERPTWLLAVGLGGRAPDGAECAALGRRLHASVRARDLVCWLAPSGYAVLLVGAQAADARRAAERLAPALGTLVAIVCAPPGEAIASVLRALCVAPDEAQRAPQAATPAAFFAPPDPPALAPPH